MFESWNMNDVEIDVAFSNLKIKQENSRATMRKYCQDLRNQINLKSEQVIAGVTRRRQELHDQIDMYEENSIQGFDRSEKSFREELDTKITQVKSQLEELKGDDFNEEDAHVRNRARQALNDLSQRLDELIFNQKRLLFIENENEVANLGFLHYPATRQSKPSTNVTTTIDLSTTFTRFSIEKPSSQTQVEILDNGNYIFTFACKNTLKWYLTSGKFELIDSANFDIKPDSSHTLHKFENTFIIAFQANSMLKHVELRIHPIAKGEPAKALYTYKWQLIGVETCEQGLFVLESFTSVNFYTWKASSAKHAILAQFNSGVEAFRAKAQRFYFAYNATHTLKVFDQNGEQLHCIANQYGSCFQVLPTSGNLLFFDEKKLVFVYVNMKGEKMRQDSLQSFRDMIHQPRIIVTASDDVFIYGSEADEYPTQAGPKTKLEFTFSCKLLRMASLKQNIR